MNNTTYKLLSWSGNELDTKDFNHAAYLVMLGTDKEVYDHLKHVNLDGLQGYKAEAIKTIKFALRRASEDFNNSFFRHMVFDMFNGDSIGTIDSLIDLGKALEKIEY